MSETETLTEAEWNSPITIRRGEWHTLQNDNARLLSELAEAKARVEELIQADTARSASSESDAVGLNQNK